MAIVFSSSSYKEWRTPQKSALRVYIPNMQELLIFGEMINEQNRLHPDWYDVITPVEYMLANGVIKSFEGYLLLDLQRSVDFALVWKDDTPELLAVIPSSFGLDGAENLARNFDRYAEVQKENGIWKGHIDVPHFSPVTVFWTGKNKHLLLAITPKNTKSFYDFSGFYQEEYTKKEHTTIQWNQESMLQVSREYHTPMQDFHLQIQVSDKELDFRGTGTWIGEDLPKATYEDTLIAGWSTAIQSSFQVHKTKEDSLCTTEGYKKLQQLLEISTSCPKTEAAGLYFLASSEFFQHIKIPLNHIEMRIWTEEGELRMDGNIAKSQQRGLFALYVWLYQLSQKYRTHPVY